MTMKFFKQGTPLKWIAFCKDIEKVFKDQIINDGVPRSMMAWNLLKDNVVQCFKAAAATHE